MCAMVCIGIIDLTLSSSPWVDVFWILKMIRRVQFCLLVICTEWMGHQEMLEPPESIRDSNSGPHELPGLTSRPIWWALSAHVSAQNTNTHAPHLSLEFHFNFDPHDFFFLCRLNRFL